MALLRCVAALDDLKLEGDQTVGVTIVTRALEEPIRQIVINAGVRAILMHLALWDVPRARPPPVAAGGSVGFEYVSCEDWALPGAGA